MTTHKTVRIMSIHHDSVVDGTGLRSVIFFAGCPHFCRGCHNPKSWNIKNGMEMTVNEVIEESLNPLTNITFSGGDPFYQAEEAVEIAKALKQYGKNIWAYTGWTLDELISNHNPAQLELLENIDVLVDGPFIQDEKDLTLLYRGSRNQHIINMRDIQS